MGRAALIRRCLFIWVAILPAATASPAAAAGESGLEISASAQILGASSAYGVAAADFDLDGDVDAAFANLDAGDNDLYINVSTPDELTFTPTSVLGSGRLAIASGDIDGDGWADIVTAGLGVRPAFHRNVDGLFPDALEFGPVDSAASLALADLDADGDLDLITASPFLTNRIFLNYAGEFASLLTFGGKSRCVVVGDLEGDGVMEILTGNLDRPDVLYRFINGNISAGLEFGPAGTTNCLALGDVDGNGDLDVIAGRDDSQNLLYLVDGESIATPIPFGEEDRAKRGLALADLDGDGDLDLVVANNRKPSLAYRNHGGSPDIFGDVPDWSQEQGLKANGIALVDVDGDGDADLVFAMDGEYRIYRNGRPPFDTDPDSTWTPPAADTRRLRLADLDLDGDLDLVAANHGRSSIYLNAGEGLPASPSAWLPPEEFSNDVAIGDLDGDGDPDLVFGNGKEDIIQALRPVSIFVNRTRESGGTVLFNAAPDETTSSHEATRGVTLGDVNGDGRLDLVTGNGEFFDSRNQLFLNRTGDAFFPVTDWTSVDENLTASVALADLDRDGGLDLICANGNDLDRRLPSIYRHSGHVFSPMSEAIGNILERSQSVAVDDLSGDSNQEIVFGVAGRDPVYRNLHPGPLVECSRLEDDFTRQVVLTDIDGDGDPDLVSANESAPSTIYQNRASASCLQVPASWRSSQTAPTRTVAIGDIDGDGDPDLVLGNRFVSGTPHPMTLHRGLRIVRTQRLPDNPPSLRNLRLQRMTEVGNLVSVNFEAMDPESDPMWIVPEFRFVDESTWRPLGAFGTIDGRLGLISSSPAGRKHDFTWDLTPFSVRGSEIMLRLRVVPVPGRVAQTADPIAFYVAAGRLIPQRPEILAETRLISFPPVAWGDSATVALPILNRGNLDLIIDEIEVPAGFHAEIPPPIAAGSSDTLNVRFTPKSEFGVSGDLVIHSNDPVSSILSIKIDAEVRPLRAEAHSILDRPGPAPLGLALGLLVTPLGGTRIETGAVHFRSRGAPSFADTLQLLPTSSDRSQPLFAIFPAEVVTEAGIEYYLTLSNDPVTVVDPPNAPLSAFRINVASPNRVETSAIPDSAGFVHQGRPLTIQAALPSGGLLESGTVFFREGGAAAFDSLALDSLVAGIGKAVIPGDRVGVRGIEFLVRVRTAGGMNLTDTAGVEPPVQAHVVPVHVQHLSDPRNFPARTYHLLSFPVESGDQIPSALQNDLGSFDPSRWRMFSYFSDSAYAATKKYDEVDFNTPIGTGRGYWLVASSSHAVDIALENGVSTSTSRSYPVELKPGRNLIANPFSFPVSWNDVLVESFEDSADIEQAMGYDGQGFPAVSVLLPFEGYWVKNTGDAPITLRIPPHEFIEAVPAVKPASDPESDPLRIRLDVVSGDAADRFNIAGIADAAREAWDRMDLSKPPPPPGGAPELYFPHREWTAKPDDYSRDIRDAARVLRDGDVWFFDVASPGPEPADARLEISVSGDLPDGHRLFLVDHGLDRRIELESPGAAYSFLLRPHARVAEAAARFELRLEPDGTGADPASPEVTRLLPVSPNPFHSRTVIRFELANKGTAALSIFDVTGRKVRDFEPALREPGRYEILWDGSSGDGSETVPGVYFVRLSTDGSRLTGKIIRTR